MPIGSLCRAGPEAICVPGIRSPALSDVCAPFLAGMTNLSKIHGLEARFTPPFDTIMMVVDSLITTREGAFMLAHHRRPLTVVSISLVFLFACGEDRQSIGPECELQETIIYADDDSDLGFSAEEVLDTIATEGASTIDWEDGDDATLDWEFVDGHDVRLGEMAPEDNADDNGACTGEYLLIGGTFEVETDDGELAENVDVDLQAESTNEAELDGKLPVADIQGDLAVDQNSDDDVLLFEGDIDADGSTGTLQLDSFEENGDATDHATVLLGQWE